MRGERNLYTKKGASRSSNTGRGKTYNGIYTLMAYSNLKSGKGSYKEVGALRKKNQWSNLDLTQKPPG